MKHPITSCSVAVLSGLLVFSLSASAWAGGGHRQHGGHGHGYSHYGYSHDHAKPRLRHHRHSKHHRHNDDQLFIGLLVGGLLGYAVSNTRDRGVSNYYPPTPAEPAPHRGYYPTSSPNSTYQQNTCLQEREYQTTVTVGGRQVQAYGTACLQPDGSWSRGPAQTAGY